MDLIFILPIFLILSFVVVLSNQLIQAAGIKSGIKYWSDIKTTIITFLDHNDLGKSITNPVGGILGSKNS
jgi:hypothetical protein